MDAPANPFTQVLVTLFFVVPIASLLLHLEMKPDFWTPSLIILAGSVAALAIGEFMHSKSVLYAVRNGVVFGLLLSFVSVVIGLVFRLFAYREYAQFERRQMQKGAWKRHSRILAVVAMIFGIVVLALGWLVLKDMEIKSTLLAVFAFYLAYMYWCSPRGAASVSQWLQEGDITQGEPSNSTAESDARKDSARGSP